MVTTGLQTIKYIGAASVICVLLFCASFFPSGTACHICFTALFDKRKHDFYTQCANNCN